jgi:hypothetical protein
MGKVRSFFSRSGNRAAGVGSRQQQQQLPRGLVLPAPVLHRKRATTHHHHHHHHLLLLLLPRAVPEGCPAAA